MSDAWHVWPQFLFRLLFGLALAMAITPRANVSSSFFRIHSWVLLGLGTLVSLVCYGRLGEGTLFVAVIWLGLGITLTSYLAAVVWWYDRAVLGKGLLALIAALGLVAALVTAPPMDAPLAIMLAVMDCLSGGIVMGSTLASMLLGHWYLNTPSMTLAPLRRLILLLAVWLVVRLLVCGSGIALALMSPLDPTVGLLSMIAFRWLAGLIGLSTVVLLAWKTLAIPNTQSATGLLYAGVVLVFLGELTSLWISLPLRYPG